MPVHNSTRACLEMLALTFGEDAGVAQLAEQLFCKQQVTGSIPVAGSNRRVNARLAPNVRKPEGQCERLAPYARNAALIRARRPAGLEYDSLRGPCPLPLRVLWTLRKD